MADHLQQYAKNLVKTVPISMRVMWKFVNLHSRHQEKESLRKWWQERNDTVIKEKKLKRIYWRHQRAADTDPDLWSIQVLYSAIVDGNVTTTLDQRKALHFLSNTPENVTEQQYTDFCKKLEKHYETLLKDAAGDFVKSLRGPLGENVTVVLQQADLKQKHDDDTLGLDVIDELHESLQSVMNMWKEFATAFNKDLRLDGKILDAIQAAQGERKLQMVLGFLMGKITKLDIHEVLQNLQEQAEFAKQWEQLYLHEDEQRRIKGLGTITAAIIPIQEKHDGYIPKSVISEAMKKLELEERAKEWLSEQGDPEMVPLGKFLTALQTSFEDVMLEAEDFVAAIEKAQKVIEMLDKAKPEPEQV